MWVEDDTNGCFRHCSYSSNASAIYRTYKYLSTALGQPELLNPFSSVSTLLPSDIVNEAGCTDLLSMTRLKEEHYLNLFWQSYHVLLPILHFETFVQYYNSLWALDDSVRDNSALVDIVLALCTQYGNCFMASLATSGPYPRGSPSVGQCLFDHARQLMSTKTESLSLDTIQYHLLSAIYLANTSSQNAANDCITQAHRTALALGLHLEPPSTISEQEKTLRREIWGSISALDFRISIDLGQPFVIHQSDSTCLPPLTIEDSAATLPADNLSTTFEGVSLSTYFHNYLSLTMAARKAHEAFVTHCAVALEANNTSDFYASADVIKDCANFLLECIKPVHDWVKQVPNPLKTPRRGAGKPFSTSRSSLDFEESVPAWLQRQRVMLELSYHDFLMIFHRPFIRFPSSSVGRIPISSEHSVWSLNHAIIITQIISQILTESDVLSFIHETTRILWDATVTLLAFVTAHPFCPHSPSAHAALQKAVSAFDVLGTRSSDAANRATETTRTVLVYIESIAGGFRAGSSSAAFYASQRSADGSNAQRQTSLHFASGPANHDERLASDMLPDTTSMMDMEALDLFSGLDDNLGNQLLDPSYMSIQPLIDQAFDFDGRL